MTTRHRRGTQVIKTKARNDQRDIITIQGIEIQKRPGFSVDFPIHAKQPKGSVPDSKRDVSIYQNGNPLWPWN